MSGTIPDVFTDTSPLRVFTALSSGLTGPIPETLTLCPDLEILDLGYNYLSGTIPRDLGASRYLRYAYLMSNNLTGELFEVIRWFLPSLIRHLMNVCATWAPAAACATTS